MARKQAIKILRTTRAALDSAASGGGLLIGEPYLITDEDRIAVGLSATTYQTYAKSGEIVGTLKYGAATLDFSASNIATVDITGQSWVTSESIIMASIRPVATASHSEDEHMMLATFIALSAPAGLIVPGVGFSIVGVIYDTSLLSGTINIGWMGA